MFSCKCYKIFQNSFSIEQLRVRTAFASHEINCRGKPTSFEKEVSNVSRKWTLERLYYKWSLQARNKEDNTTVYNPFKITVYNPFNPFKIVLQSNKEDNTTVYNPFNFQTQEELCCLFLKSWKKFRQDNKISGKISPVHRNILIRKWFLVQIWTH